MCVCNPTDPRPFCGNKQTDCRPKPKAKPVEILSVTPVAAVPVATVELSTGDVEKYGETKGIDWLRLEHEYVSGNMTVAELVLPYGLSPTSGNVTRQTQGWGRRRAEFRQKALEHAQREAQRKVAESLNVMADGLSKILPAIPAGVLAGLKKKLDKKTGKEQIVISASEAQTLLNMTLLVTGKPTSINQVRTDTDDADSDIDETLDQFGEDVHGEQPEEAGIDV